MDIKAFIIDQRERALLVGDYGSYRQQLSRRLHTVRKRLFSASKKGSKYTARAAVTVEDIASNHELGIPAQYLADAHCFL